MRKLAIIGATVVAAATFGACGAKANEPFKDAPRSKVRNSSPADIIEMPDGFSNLAVKCDGPNRVYVAFKSDQNRAAVAVVPNDPRCTNR